MHRLLAGWRQAGRLPWAAALGTAAGCAGILSPYVYHQAQAYWAFCDPKQVSCLGSALSAVEQLYVS